MPIHQKKNAREIRRGMLFCFEKYFACFRNLNSEENNEQHLRWCILFLKATIHLVFVVADYRLERL